ncbi:Hypp5708 [Branchiostoma lanceolatum]|uniref:Hypp5708 protein n=1 Tax=Branchiostoma lanceolatum TaxID=7740 RepID=A0A8J9YSD2_BRALA|nr:Hypp5708 [Branchiostoma lanceolatum]
MRSLAASMGLELIPINQCFPTACSGPPPPEGRLQSRAGVSNLLRQLFQDLQQDPETPLANLKSQGTGWKVLSRQFGQTIPTGSDDEKTFDLNIYSNYHSIDNGQRNLPSSCILAGCRGVAVQRLGVTEYVSSLDQAFKEMPQDASSDATAKWKTMQGAIHNAALATFGKKSRPSQDWFDAHISKMEPVLEAKRRAFLSFKRCPSGQTLAALRTARSTAQRTARECANDYWQQLCVGIQRSAESGDLQGMYNGIKKALGPTVKKTAPLKSLSGEKITDQKEQMSQLYSRETSVSDTVLNSLEDLPIMEELDVMPTIEELSKAIDSLPCGKAQHPS